MKRGVIFLVIISILLIALTIGIYAHEHSDSSTSSDSTSDSPSDSDSSSDSEKTDSVKDSDKIITESEESSEQDMQTSIDEDRDEIQIIPDTKIEGVKQKIRLREIEAISDLGLEQEKDTDKIMARLSNGKKVEVKIMPNTASRIALSKLRSQDRTLELKEVGKKNDLNLVYVSESIKTKRFLGLFKVKYRLRVMINAQTGKVMKLDKPWWSFLASKDLEESEIENMTLELIKPIQDIIIIKNTEEILDLDEYFLNAELYSISEIDGVSFVLDDGILTLTPNIDYIGTTFVRVISYKGNESLETLFNIIVSEANLSIQTTQYPAILWEKVRWKKKIKAEKQEKIKIELPEQSENITLIELDENEEIISQEKIITEFIEIKPDKVSSYEIEYYTSKPYVIEESIVKTRKKITIIGSKNVHYTDVLAFNYLPIEAKEEVVKLYQIKEKGREEVEIDKYDLNENGLVDYIEWVVPSLSNQTYELIIEIKGAEHLDSNRNFISDIYKEVYKLDDIWSEEIPSADYVRVTFEQELDNTRDITLYPRVVSGNPRIEIYEINGTQIIAEFTSINSYEYNKVYLTNLQGTQDTFDLLILDGSLEIDYIVDPAVVSLDSPANDTYSDNPTQIFGCSATDDLMLANITLYGSWLGGWHANETNDVTGTENSTTFTKTLEDGSYIWNCLVYDNDSNSAWYSSNYTLTIDITLPNINIVYPANTTYNVDVTELNYTFTETNPDSCWYSTNSGATNSSTQTCGTNWTGLTSIEGSNTWIVYMNDTAGNENSTSVTFFKDTIAPVITIDSPANTTYNTKTIDLNVSADTTINTWWYSNNSGITNNTFTPNQTYTWKEGSNTVYVWANDSLGNKATSNVTFSIDSTYPLIDYGEGTSINHANLSQSNIYVNVSVTETNEDTITFRLYNSISAVNETSFTDSTRSINWTSLIDGAYTYNVTINDTLGNSNTTITRTITLDTTAPIVTFNCDKTSVYNGDTITCSCSATDNIDSSPSVSYTANPPISNAGDFSTICTVTDYIGNSASSGIDYIVKTHGGVETFPYWKMTYILTNEQFEKGYTKEMKNKERIRIKINGKEHHLGIVDLTKTTATINVSSISQQAVLNVGDEKKFEVTDDYYYDLLVTLSSIIDDKANITIISIHEEIPIEEIKEKEREEKVKKSYWWVWIILVVMILLIIIVKKRKAMQKYFKKKKDNFA